MGVNKVVYGGQTKLDVSTDTVMPSTLIDGYTAHDNSGTLITGNVSLDGKVYQDDEGYVVLSPNRGTQPILQSRTVDVAVQDQVITPTNYIITLGTTNNLRTYSANSNYSLNIGKSSTSQLITGTEYNITGLIDIYDSNDDLLKSYTINKTFNMPDTNSTSVTLFEDNTDLHFKKIVYYRNASYSYVSLTKSSVAEDLKIIVNLVFSDTVLYDGLSSVTVHGGYSVNVVKNLIYRNDTSFTTIDLPSDITKIGPYAFAKCSWLNIDSLPDSVTTIGEYAFYACSNIKTLSRLPNSLTFIGNNAFYNCSNLALTSLPTSITEIAGNAFANCLKLAITNLPTNLTTIGTSAFNSCKNIRISSIPNGVTNINDYVFQNCGDGITVSALSDNVTRIGASAFYGCSSITTMSGKNVTYIGAYAFDYCTSLESASFPSNSSALTSTFGTSTANGACQNLTFADIGSCPSLNSDVFRNCYALRTIVLRKTDGVCNIASSSAFINSPFEGYNNLTGTAYVPSSLIDTYKTTGRWKTMYDAGNCNFAAIEGSQYELQEE